MQSSEADVHRIQKVRHSSKTKNLNLTKFVFILAFYTNFILLSLAMYDDRPAVN